MFLFIHVHYSENHDTVTIFFSDIVRFTDISRALSPVKVCNMLDRLYLAFDALANKHKVFKVETVGDCYLACTGIPNPQEKHATIMARFAWACLQAFSDLDALIDQALGDEKVKGIVIISGKPGSFAGGMDLNVIARMKDDAGENPAQGLFDGLMRFHGMLRKIERAGMDDKNKGGKPIATALPGTTMGIGYEIAISTHRIFAAPNPSSSGAPHREECGMSCMLCC